MSKVKVLHQLIQNVSGYNNEEFTSSVCSLIQDSNACHEIACCDCPFNSVFDFDDCAIELDKSNEVTNASTNNNPKTIREA